MNFKFKRSVTIRTCLGSFRLLDSSNSSGSSSLGAGRVGVGVLLVLVVVLAIRRATGTLCFLCECRWTAASAVLFSVVHIGA